MPPAPKPRPPPIAPPLLTRMGPSAAVHAQALAVLNIKSWWRTLFLVVLGKYALMDHVLSDEANPDRSAWVQMDCTIVTWIYDTITGDLQQMVMLRNPNAHVTWAVLEYEFLGQRESHTLLSVEFRTIKQGVMPITDFCRRLETMDSALTELGDPVGDLTL
ncbi:uncharacterized protein [Miscanthus floridulus]|uniref:uncharacterized protein n=1 Tax=Miscanthus floridulus TaxID=154761 RepID=UPI0034599B9F